MPDGMQESVQTDGGPLPERITAAQRTEVQRIEDRYGPLTLTLGSVAGTLRIGIRSSSRLLRVLEMAPDGRIISNVKVEQHGPGLDDGDHGLLRVA